MDTFEAAAEVLQVAHIQDRISHLTSSWMRKRGSKICGGLGVLRDRLDDKRSLEVLYSVGEEPCQLPRFRMNRYVFVFSSEQGRRPNRPSGEARTGEY